jgi:flagellum-specific peptidoglycan hydrolase FlgJ
MKIFQGIIQTWYQNIGFRSQVKTDTKTRKDIKIDMRKSKTLRTLASALLVIVLLISIPFPQVKAKSYTDADVIKMFKGDTELDTEKVLDVIAAMDLNAKQRNFFKVIIPLAVQDMIDNDILASLTIAQSVWEGGWGVGNMAVVANNIFGIMAAPSWTGKVYNTTTKQVYNTYAAAVKGGGSRFFRAYDSWAESLEDHSNLFLTSDRYEVFIGLRDYKAACKYVYSTGYATSKNYPNELIGTIESHKLTIFDTIAKEILKAREIAASIMPTSVSINASKITIGLGSSFTLKATVQPSNANNTITWTTDKNGISVSEGIVSADKVGVTNVLAETVNGMGVECVVTVIENFDFVVIGSKLEQYTGNSVIAAVPTGVSSISANSFKNKKSLGEVIIPAAVKSISTKAFAGCDKSMTICGYAGSYAEEFAKKNSFTFKSITNILLDKTNNFATDISPKSTVSELLVSLGADAEIKDAYNESIKNEFTEFVGTGCTVTVGGTEYTVSVKGDVNGDGIISTTDFQTLLRYFKNLKHLDGAQFAAADVDNDGNITTADYLKIKYAFQTGSREVK